MSKNNHEGFIIVEEILEKIKNFSTTKNVLSLLEHSTEITQSKHNSFINKTTIKNLDSHLKIDTLLIKKYSITIDGRELNIMLEGNYEKNNFNITIAKENNNISGTAWVGFGTDCSFFDNIEIYNASIIYKISTIYYNILFNLFTRNSKEVIHFIKDKLIKLDFNEISELVDLKFDEKIQITI